MMRSPYFRGVFAGLFALASFAQLSAFGQDPFFDEGKDLWGSETFIDIQPENENSDKPSSVRELEEGGNSYYSNEEIYQFEQQFYQQNITAINYDKALSESVPTLRDNILYGVGTGMMIGTWFAVFSKGNARSNFSLLGSGAVFGGLVGFLVGTKAFYIVPPKKVDENQQKDPQLEDEFGSPNLPMKLPNPVEEPGLAIGYRFDF